MYVRVYMYQVLGVYACVCTRVGVPSTYVRVYVYQVLGVYACVCTCRCARH
jgi:hypothetical protein